MKEAINWQKQKETETLPKYWKTTQCYSINLPF